MKSILILGGDGMLGHKILQRLQAVHTKTICTIYGGLDDPDLRKIPIFTKDNTKENVDAEDLSSLQKTLQEIRPEVIVNCIGVIKQRPEAKNPIPSILLNSLLPHNLAEMSREWDGRVIHFSTDCVFSGRQGKYREEDPSDAEDLYGKTKYLGEVATGNALTLRTSIIGRELRNFKSLLEWFLSCNNSTVRGFTKAIYTGVTTNHMADSVLDIIENHPKLCGLYHLASSPISKYDLLCLIRDKYELDIEVIPDSTFECDRSLIGEKFQKATGYSNPGWEHMIREMAADTTPYEDWRN